jgi:tetratricopeptide (TPR) repeat protein
MTSQLDELALELEVAGTARPRDAARYAAVLERAVQACKTDPAAEEWFDLGDLYLDLDLATEYQHLERHDDALAAADAAVAAGLQMRPDARCLRAEILMRAGRVAEAEPIWVAVHADTPEDVWLYSNAGIEYADAGEHGNAWTG